MFDEYLKREDVIKFIDDIKMNPKCFQKTTNKETLYGQNIKDELALYLFYDTIFKYKIIIDDKELFPDFFTQVTKLFRKIELIDDIIVGVNKLLINTVANKLDARDIESKEDKNKIIKYFYQKYIIDGYFVHGYSSTYEEFIKGRNFLPEQYPNHYQKMIKIQQIFNKHKVDKIEKNFRESNVHFTDDFVMGCFYSAVSPGYFYQLLVSNEKDSINYLKQNKTQLISNFKKYMSSSMFSNSEQKTVLKGVEEEWHLLNRVPRKISLLFVKRSIIMKSSNDKLNDYLESDKDLDEIIERILAPKNSDVLVNRVIRYGEYQLVTLDNFYKNTDDKNEDKIVKNSTLGDYKLLNSYGVVSILLILGSLFITLGVIFTIIMILRGM